VANIDLEHIAESVAKISYVQKWQDNKEVKKAVDACWKEIEKARNAMFSDDPAAAVDCGIRVALLWMSILARTEAPAGPGAPIRLTSKLLAQVYKEHPTWDPKEIAFEANRRYEAQSGKKFKSERIRDKRVKSMTKSLRRIKSRTNGF
jgi:hypothetical protein